MASFTFPILFGHFKATNGLQYVPVVYSLNIFHFLRRRRVITVNLCFRLCLATVGERGRFQIVLDCLERGQEFKTAITLQHSLKFVFSGN